MLSLGAVIPPFLETDVSISVGIYLGEEVVELLVRDSKASTSQCIAKLFF